MSLYAIKDKDGELRDVNGRTAKSEFGFGAFAFVHYGLAKNHQQSAYPDGHVVELVEKAEPMEVSGGAGEWLADLREELAHGYTANSANYYVTKLKCQHDMSIEDIFRALDVGWTVKQPKRYVLPMPGTEYHSGEMHGNAQYFAVKGTNNWRPDAIALGTDDAVQHGYTVTQADIDAAPAWVKAIKPVEVTDHD